VSVVCVVCLLVSWVLTCLELVGGWIRIFKTHPVLCYFIVLSLGNGLQIVAAVLLFAVSVCFFVVSLFVLCAWCLMCSSVELSAGNFHRVIPKHLLPRQSSRIHRIEQESTRRRAPLQQPPQYQLLH
jgi:hypothetical protein